MLGGMDDDGFYQGQLMSGQTGLIPSNFIEKVMDESGERGELFGVTSKGWAAISFQFY